MLIIKFAEILKIIPTKIAHTILGLELSQGYNPLELQECLLVFYIVNRLGLINMKNNRLNKNKSLNQKPFDSAATIPNLDTENFLFTKELLFFRLKNNKYSFGKNQ